MAILGSIAILGPNKAKKKPKPKNGAANYKRVMESSVLLDCPNERFDFLNKLFFLRLTLSLNIQKVHCA